MRQRRTNDTEKELLAGYVLEQLDNLKGYLNDVVTAAEGSPSEPPRDPSALPAGGLSALEAIGMAIFRAEERWRR